MTDDLTHKEAHAEVHKEAIEGIDDSSPADSWGEYPLDTVFVRKDQRTVGDIVARINKGRYKLDPEFQRDFVWNAVQQSRLIESSLMRIPLPVLYLAEDIDGKIIVVDGLQRLTTFWHYLNDKFGLKKVGSGDPNSVITGKRFSQLPIHLQERIEDTQLILYILDPKAPERARLDIFERVNSGVPLTRQQMRNSLYSGPATRWLRTAATHEAFLQATGGILNAKTMRDREVINRFCAFYLLGYQSYKGDMEEFLGKALVRMNQMPEEDLQKMQQDFIRSMKLNFMLFGGHAFRKSLAKNNNDEAKSVINASLFDVLSTALAKHCNSIRDKDEKIPDTIRMHIIKLVKTTKFNTAISRAPNNIGEVKTRHARIEAAFKEIGLC